LTPASTVLSEGFTEKEKAYPASRAQVPFPFKGCVVHKQASLFPTLNQQGLAESQPLLLLLNLLTGSSPILFT